MTYFRRWPRRLKARLSRSPGDASLKWAGVAVSTKIPAVPGVCRGCVRLRGNARPAVLPARNATRVSLIHVVDRQRMDYAIAIVQCEVFVLVSILLGRSSGRGVDTKANIECLSTWNIRVLLRMHDMFVPT